MQLEATRQIPFLQSPRETSKVDREGGKRSKEKEGKKTNLQQEPHNEQSESVW